MPRLPEARLRCLLRGQHRDHSLAFHTRHLFDFADIDELLEDIVEDPFAFVDVLQLAATEEHVHQYLVVVFQEFACLVDLRVHVMIAGLGADADFFQLLLMDLGFVLFVGLLIAQFAIVEDLTDGRALVRGDLNEVESRLAGQVEGLLRRHDAELLAIDANEADGTDADLIVDPKAPILLCVAIAICWRTNTSIS